MEVLKDLETKITQLLENEGVMESFELYSVRVHQAGRKRIVAILMDRNEGRITLDECADWNRRVGSLIEENGLMEGPYLVELSSPGLDRPLKTLRDFERVIGKKLQIEYRDTTGSIREKTFTLVHAAETELSLRPAAEGQELRLPMADIVRAKQAIKL